jgi:hypothetical protein
MTNAMNEVMELTAISSPLALAYAAPTYIHPIEESKHDGDMWIKSRNTQ